MPTDPSQFNWDKLQDMAEVGAVVGGALLWPFRQMKKWSLNTFVRKVEDDGTQIFVHSKDWEKTMERVDRLADRCEKLADIIDTERPR